MTDPAAKNREAAGRRSRENYKKLAEIGPLPAVVNPERKAACRTDLHRFLVEYFPKSTGLSPFSDDHIRMIARLQRCILFGGMMVEAVFRGFAKTSIGEGACLWGGLYGHRRFIILLGADAAAVDGNLESIKYELESNDLLYEDFPEVCHAIRELDGRTLRSKTQELNGERTHLGWAADKVVLPTIAGSDASGVVIQPQSILSFSRGIKHKTVSGDQVRPDFVFGDDLQTDESALSPGQVNKRMSKLKRSVLKAAGHGGSMAVYVAATIIEKDDMIDQLMDPKKNPQWHGERVPMVKKWADAHDTFWLSEYAEKRVAWNRDDPDDKKRAMREAMLLYESRRAEADAGCVVTWDACYYKKDEDYEISAIQHAYNMLIDDGPEVFAAECQNEPPSRVATGDEAIEPDDVLAKVTGPDRRVVPAWASHLTAFVDVQSNMLWYVVAAWSDDFSGCIIDYGGYPDQGRVYYTKADVKHTMANLNPEAGLEGQIWTALERLTARIMGESWKREDGADMDVELCLIDEGFQTPTIYEFCRRSVYSSRIMPAKGDAIGAIKKPFEEYQKRQGETLGEHWRRVKVGGKSVRHIIHNTNHWKKWVWNRIRVSAGDPGSLSIHKGTVAAHRMLADHLAASERAVLVEANGRSVYEFVQVRGRDNDLFDCTVGAAVAASVVGCKLRTAPTESTGKKKKRRRATGAWAA